MIDIIMPITYQLTLDLTKPRSLLVSQRMSDWEGDSLVIAEKGTVLPGVDTLLGHVAQANVRHTLNQACQGEVPLRMQSKENWLSAGGKAVRVKDMGGGITI